MLILFHLLLKQNVASTLFKRKDIPAFSQEWGHYNDPQVLNTYATYSDLVMEQLLIKLKPLIEKKIYLLRYTSRLWLVSLPRYRGWDAKSSFEGRRKITGVLIANVESDLRNTLTGGLQ